MTVEMKMVVMLEPVEGHGRWTGKHVSEWDSSRHTHALNEIVGPTYNSKEHGSARAWRVCANIS